MRKVGLLIASTAAILSMPTTHASAHVRRHVTHAGPFTYVKLTSVEPQEGDVTLQAFCPRGSRATGGGGAITGTNSTIGALSPFDTDHGVADAGYEIAGHASSDGPTQATVTAICMKRKRGGNSLEYASVTGSGTSVDEHDCGSGHVVGGGEWLAPPYSGEQLTESTPYPQDGWYFKAEVPPGGMYSIYTVCIPGGKRETRVVNQVLPYDGTTNAYELHASCPAHFHISGGGFGSHYGAGESVPTDGHDRDKAADDGWTAIVRGGGFVQAVCVK